MAAEGVDRAGEVHLLPAFDEFIIGYADRRPVLGEHFDQFNATVSSNGMFAPTVIADGRVVGVWRRRLRRDRVEVSVTPFEALDDRLDALRDAAERYGKYLGLRPELSV